MSRQRPLSLALLVAAAAWLSFALGTGVAAAAPSPPAKNPPLAASATPKFKSLALQDAWTDLRAKGEQILVDVQTSGPRVTSQRTALDLFRENTNGRGLRQLTSAQKARLNATPLDRSDSRLQIVSTQAAGAAPSAASLSGGTETGSAARGTSARAAGTNQAGSVPTPTPRPDGICNILLPSGPGYNVVSACNFWSLTISQSTVGSRIVVSADFAVNASRGCPAYCGEIPKVSIDFLDAKFGATQGSQAKVFTEPISRLPTEYGTWSDPNCVNCELTYARWRGSVTLPTSAGPVSNLNARTCHTTTSYSAATRQPYGTSLDWFINSNGLYDGTYIPYAERTCYLDAAEPLAGLPNDDPVPTGPIGAGPGAPERLGPGNAASPNVTKCSAGDPVDCATGNMYESATDLAVGGRGLGLAQTRTYNAQAPAQSNSGTMGYGWTAPYTDAVVVDSAAQTATVVQADGSSVPFKKAADGTYGAQPWILASLKATTAGFTYTLPDQRTMNFSTAGRLVSVADEQGNTTTIGRDATGRVSEAVDPAGRKLLYAYNGNGRITTVTDPIGRKVTYGYDAQGNLVSVTKADGAVWRYGYDTQHLLTSRTDPRGNTTTSDYDDQRRVVSQTDAMGRNRKWRYGTDDDGRDQTTITEPNGSTTVKSFLNGQPTRIVRAQGTEDETTKVLRYNAAGVKSRVTDENGNTTTLSYDAAGNVATVSSPAGTMRMTYDERRHQTSVRTPSGMAQELAYDGKGNVLSTTLRSPDKEQEQRAAFEYDGVGQLVKSTDPLGRATTYSYSPAGDRLSVTTPLGNKTTFGYDGASRMTSQVSANGNTTGKDPAAFRTTWTLDPENRPTSMTDRLGRITRATYDAIGNPTSETDGEGRTTTYEYNKANEQTLVSDPAGAKTRFDYDAMGTVVKRTDPNGNATAYENDLLQRRISDTDAKGRTKRFAYDPVGNLTRSTDAAGRSVERSYDAANRLIPIVVQVAGVAAHSRRQSVWRAWGVSVSHVSAVLRRSSTASIESMTRLVNQCRRIRAQICSTGFSSGL